MSHTGEQLVQSWNQVFDGAGKAIQWVEEVRPNVVRLNRESDSLILELRRLRNMAKRLGSVSDRPMTTGFFGLSQAGKSYLISALAAGTNGKLETVFDGKTLDFIDHINPPGGGKEATGLVTRFSRSTAQRESIAGFPLELRLFSEVEIAKILVNSYFNDFDKEKVDYQCDQNKVSALFKNISKGTQYVPGVTEDDVVDLQDYAMDNFGKSLAVLQSSFWPKAISLAPFLSIKERAKLFSILWGEIPELTQTYILFAQTLASIGHPATVYAPLECVVKEVNGALSQADSIMNVDMIGRLGSSRDYEVNVRPLLADGTVGEPVLISASHLTVLTAELVFPLINKTRVDAFETVDLLDFPGYRGRLGIRAISEIKEDDEGKNPIAQLILRGKVAYLFERYR